MFLFDSNEFILNPSILKYWAQRGISKDKDEDGLIEATSLVGL
jgi:hypothetical protein